MSMQNNSPDTTRFTLCADPSVEAMLAETMRQVADDISRLPSAPYIRSVLLGGGYGRAEGGVFRTGNGDARLYNDLDFFVISQDVSSACRKQIDAELKPIRKKWADRVGIDVDFSRARTRKSLRQVSRTLMYQELQAGHRLIFGEPDAFALLPEPDFASIPFSEGARLMLNRGAGLLMAWNRLQEKQDLGDDDIDFVIRNIYKTVFGSGDALLIRRKQYCAGTEARLKRLESLSDLPENLAGFYKDALAFKSLPYREPRERLLEKWNAARSLWIQTLEAFLVNETGEKMDKSEVRAGILSSRLLSEGNFLRNVLLNLIAFRLGLKGIRWLSHPRRVLLSHLYDFLLAIPGEQGYIKSNTDISSNVWLRIWDRFN